MQLEKFEALYDEIAARVYRNSLKRKGERKEPAPQTHRNFFVHLKRDVLHNKGFRDACPVDEKKREILRKYPIWAARVAEDAALAVYKDRVC